MMPRFQAEMQSANNLPVCRSAKDLPSSDSGRTLLQNNDDQIRIYGHGNNIVHPPCNTGQYKSQVMENMRKTMLEQDAAFRQQVRELHRVYAKQVEMTNEMKTEEHSTHNSEVNISKSNPILSRKPFGSDQTYHITSLTSMDPNCHWPLSSFKFNADSSFVAGKSMQAHPNTSIAASSLKHPVLLTSSSKKTEKRKFDLELPADEYIVFEEKRLKQGIASVVSPSEVNSLGTDLLPSIIQRADWNKTIQLNKEETLVTTNRLPLDPNNMENPHLELPYSQRPSTDFGVQTKEINFIPVGKDLRTRSESMHQKRVSTLDEHASLKNLFSSTNLEFASQRKSIGMPWSTPKASTQAFPYSHTPATLSIGNALINKYVSLSRNSICDPKFPGVGSSQNSFIPGMEYFTSTGPHSSTSLDLNTACAAKEVESSSMYYSGHMSNLTRSLERVRATQGNEKLKGTIQDINSYRESLSQTLRLEPPKGFLMSSSYVEPNSYGTGGNLNYERVLGSSNNSQIANDQLPKSLPSLSEDNHDKVGILDCSPAHALTVGKTEWSAQGEMSKNGVDSKSQIDLNCSFNDDGSAQVKGKMKVAAGINSHQPVSPENQESSPPRGISVEKQHTRFVGLREQEDKGQKDPAMIAAEILVSFSSEGPQSYQNNTSSKSCETSPLCLDWFAGVVLEEKDITVPGGVAESDQSKQRNDGLNDFAAITPQMKEITLEEKNCNSAGKKIKIRQASSLDLPKSKQIWRTKSQKEIQGRILPSITISSGQNLLQKKHMVKGLMENEGKMRAEKKKLSKIERQRVKKGSVIPPLTVVDRPTYSFQKQQTDDAKQYSPKGLLPAWGEKNKRRGGQRRFAPNVVI